MTRDEAIARRRKQIPRAQRGYYDKAVQGKSMKAAIRSFCLECVGYQHSRIEDCPALACPLYAFRPFTQEDPAPAPPKKVPRKKKPRKKAGARSTPGKDRPGSRGSPGASPRGTSSSASISARQCSLFPDRR